MKRFFRRLIIAWKVLTAKHVIVYAMSVEENQSRCLETDDPVFVDETISDLEGLADYLRKHYNDYNNGEDYLKEKQNDISKTTSKSPN